VSQEVHIKKSDISLSWPLGKRKTVCAICKKRVLENGRMGVSEKGGQQCESLLFVVLFYPAETEIPG